VPGDGARGALDRHIEEAGLEANRPFVPGKQLVVNPVLAEARSSVGAGDPIPQTWRTEMNAMFRTNGLVGLLLCALALPACDGEDGGAMFSITTVGEMPGGEAPVITFAADHRRHVDSHATLIEQTATGALQLVDLLYLQVVGGEPRFQTTPLGDLASWGVPGGQVIATADSRVGSPWLLVRGSGDEVALVDTNTETLHSFGSYVYGVFWVDDSSLDRTVGQALLVNGGVTRDAYGNATLVSVNAVDYWDLDTRKSAAWTRMDGVFDALPGGEQYLLGARNLRLEKWQRTSTDDYGAALILIDGAGRMKYLETGDISFYDDYAFTDKTTEFIGAFAGHDLAVQAFDYGLANTSGEDSSHFCVIAESLEDPSRSALYAFQPRATYSTIPHVEDVYPGGTCSVVHYTRTASPVYSTHIPWITYHSAKSELSVARFVPAAQDFDTFVLDRGESPNWVFAEKINSIATAAGNNNEIIILYNDAQALKLAACNDWNRCGFDSSR
jgi:hypothetical protein